MAGRAPAAVWRGAGTAALALRLSRVGRTLLMAPLLTAATAWAEPARLHVITDDNYPPYLFRDDDGLPTGYLVDYWKLWEQKTAVPVTLTATRWADAQRRVDVQMPVMDGLAATQSLLRSSPQLPVIGQTALAFKDEIDKCLAAGMVATVGPRIQTVELGRLRRAPNYAEWACLLR